MTANAIEQGFAKIKQEMRLVQKGTIDEALHHIGWLVPTIQPAECANYFVNAGCTSVKI